MLKIKTQSIPGEARILGYSGVLPFVGMALAVLMWSGPSASWWMQGFTFYAAVILSFLGGIRWGVETRFEEVSTSALALSVAPSLWAFASLLLPGPRATVLMLLAGFIALGLADWFAPARGSAPWMRLLRARLTLAVAACHLLVLASWF